MAVVKLYDVTITHLTKKWKKSIVVVGGENAHALETEDFYYGRIMRQAGYDPNLELYARSKVKIEAKLHRELEEFLAYGINC